MIFTITIDNASSNEVATGYMRRIKYRDCTVFEGELLHMLCNRWSKPSLRP